MPELAKETVALLTFLLPGFLVAWVLFALTSHQKPSQAERIIQALIFTLFVRAFVFVEQATLEYVGLWFALRPWDTNAELLASLFTGLALGLFGAYVINTDSLHQFLRHKGISSRGSQPSEWCGVLAKYPRFVVLHFKDERRLYGWPEVWPSDPEKGHFFIYLPVWAHELPHTPMTGVEGILVSVADIKHIEFVQPKESTHGKQTTDTEPANIAGAAGA
jgi:hypothetical protein